MMQDNAFRIDKSAADTRRLFDLDLSRAMYLSYLFGLQLASWNSNVRGCSKCTWKGNWELRAPTF